MMKGQKGITLVALVITIIVMLILVAVTITVALDSGLFKKADEAGEKWKAEQTRETNSDFIEYNTADGKVTGINAINAIVD